MVIIKRFFILCVLLFFSVISFTQVFNNKSLLKLDGDFRSSGKVVPAPGGYAMLAVSNLRNDKGVITSHDVWIIYTNAKGKIRWKKNFSNGCISEVMDIQAIDSCLYVLVTACEPKLLKLDLKGNLLWETGLNDSSRIAKNICKEGEYITLFTSDLVAEGWKSVSYDSNLVRLSTETSYHKFWITKDGKIEKDILLENTLTEETFEPFPLTDVTGTIHYIPYKTGDIHHFSEEGNLESTDTLPVKNSRSEVWVENLIRNHLGGIIFKKVEISSYPQKHIDQVTLVCLDTNGNTHFETDIPWGSSWDNRNDLIQTSDSNYILIMYGFSTSIWKISQLGGILWQQKINNPDYSYLHFSVCEGPGKQYMLMGVIDDKYNNTKPYMVTLDKDGNFLR